MENYRIGIKLADGSFYPILEEGKPQVKTIELTTVRDDQTTVQLDLYRSSSDNMEDAEYVDTLLVENLLPRPKETPTLNLKIELDEENVLSASIEDSESGESSETKVSLVTLDSSERTIVPDFSMIDAESADNEEGDTLLDEFADNTIAIQGDAAVNNELSDNEDLNLDDFNDVDDLLSDEPVLDEMPEITDEPEVEQIQEDLPEIDDIPEVDSFATEDTILDEMPEITDEPEVEQVQEDLPEIDDIPDADSFATEDTILDEIPEITDEPEVEQVQEDLPEIDDIPDADSFATEDTILDEMPEIDLPAENDDILKDSILDEPVFDNSIDDDLGIADAEFPDFSDIPTSTQDDIEEPEFDDDGPFGIGNDYGDIDTNMDIDENEDAFAANIDTSGDLDESIPSPDLSFSDLYVNDVEDDCPEKKRCSIPVLICSICAVICVIVLLLILFLTPSKLKGKEESTENSIWAKEETPVQEVIPVPVETKTEEVTEEIDVVVEEEAKEDEIVIVEAPVVTPVEPEPVQEKVKGVEYKIKWGDTLWDIAGTYYKNPWLYREIADYNNLENPDYIISGTIITIPPR